MSSTTLKFNAESFKELDAPNLIINVWSYSDYLKKTIVKYVENIVIYR